METSFLTVEALIEALEDLPANTPLRIATQKSWPFEYSVGDPILVDLRDGTTAVYLPELEQIGPLPASAAIALRWADEDKGIEL
jgi:hypothetical protein